jgi:hypothetical protein
LRINKWAFRRVLLCRIHFGKFILLASLQIYISLLIFNNAPLIKNDEMETRNFKEVIKHQKERLLKELQKELKIKQHMKIKMVLNVLN